MDDAERLVTVRASDLQLLVVDPGADDDVVALAVLNGVVHVESEVLEIVANRTAVRPA